MHSISLFVFILLHFISHQQFINLVAKRGSSGSAGAFAHFHMNHRWRKSCKEAQQKLNKYSSISFECYCCILFDEKRKATGFTCFLF